MRPEEKLETQACNEAVDGGWTTRKLQFIGVRGAPDRIFGRGGVTKVIEFKPLGERARRQQVRRIKELTEHFGWEIQVCDTIEKVRRFLNLEDPL